MGLPSNFKDLLTHLAGGERKRPKLADALGRTYWELYYWSRNNNIPEDDWDDIMAFAAKQKIDGVTEEYLRSLKRRKSHHAAR